MAQILSEQSSPLFLPGNRALGYARVSDEYDDGTTLGTQGDKIVEYCQQHNYLLAGVIEDRITGVIYRERPGIQAILKAAKQQEFDVLVVYDMDRFSRDPVHQAIMMELLAEYRVRVECVLRKVEYTPEGKLQLYVMGFAAQLEHQRIKERTDRGRMERIQEKKYLPGGAPKPRYGYLWNDSTPGAKTAYIINPAEADIIRRMFSMAAQHMSLRAIAHQLTQEGIPSPSGKPYWKPNTVHDTLRNPFYAGKAFANRYQSVKEPGKRARVKVRPQEEWIPLPDGIVPAIVDLETFEKVQHILDINKQQSARNNKRPKEQLLRCGLAFCGYCGAKMVVQRHPSSWNKDKLRCTYECTNLRNPVVKCYGGNIEAHILDQAVWSFTTKIIRNPDLVEQALKGREQEREVASQELDIVENNLAKINRKIKNLAAWLGQTEQELDEDTFAEITTQLKLLSEQKKLWEAQREPAMKAHNDQQEIQESLKRFREWCAKTRAKLDDPAHEFTYVEKREACEQLGVKALVWRADHDPRYEIFVLPPDFVSIINNRSACKRANTWMSLPAALLSPCRAYR